MLEVRIYRILQLVCVFIGLTYCVKFEDVTDTLFGQDNSGWIAAFGDFNSDKTTDIFVIASNGKSVDLFLTPENKLTQDKKKYTRKNLISLPEGSVSNISSVVPSDYDGDSQMDILITQTNSDSSVSVTVYYGQIGSNKYDVKIESHFSLTEKLKDQPLILDYNFDMLPDVFGEIYSNGSRTLWISSSYRNFSHQPFKKESPHVSAMRVPHSNSVIDLNKDFNADLLITAENYKFESWVRTVDTFSLVDTIDAPNEKIKHIGQSSFIDLERDGSMVHILPLCIDDSCMTSKVYAYVNKKWHLLAVEFSHSDKMWGFVPPKNNESLPFSLRFGDYNMDGFTDAVAILRSQETKEIYSEQHLVLFENIPCSSATCSLSRTFTIKHDVHFGTLTPMMAAFYDVFEDGVLDLVVSVKYADGSIWSHALLNKNDPDAYFIKVMVLSGLCYDKCSKNSPPYGVNYPGPCMQYRTTAMSGGTLTSYACQLTQSSHFSLQLPYTIFGLGGIPNFIDKLEVGIPSNSKMVRHHTWNQIIPNSQMVVIPNPPNKPQSWKNKLFVTPARSILITGAVLLGCCGFIAGLVAILHIRDKIQDKKEKRQEQQYFHFNAM